MVAVLIRAKLTILQKWGKPKPAHRGNIWSYLKSYVVTMAHVGLIFKIANAIMIDRVYGQTSIMGHQNGGSGTIPAEKLALA